MKTYRTPRNTKVPIEVGYIQPTNYFPPIRMFVNVLSPEECQEIIAYGKPHMENSYVDNGDTGSYDKETRSSTQTWIKPDEIPCLKRLSLYIEKITGLSHKNQESWQLLRYKPGQKYVSHYDANHHLTPYYEEVKKMNMIKGCGERVYTFFIYLNDDFTDGTTYFPKLNVMFKPKTGCAILWNNLDKNNMAHELSQHSGMPVGSGTKWAINVWVHESQYPNGD
jgi:prolyl 4-hydroxylase